MFVRERGYDMSASVSEFKIRKHDTIGDADAEHDRLLDTCFVNTGDMDVLQDTNDNRRIVVGRTGAGKTALLRTLKESESHAIWIEPVSLSLQYLSDHALLRFFEENGVKLDLFYQLLWRHVFAVELIKAKYPEGTPTTQQKKWWDSVVSRFASADPKKAQALAYLRKWGETIWQDTEYRVKEIITTFERGIHADASLSILAGGVRAQLADTQKAEIIKRGQQVVNGLQIKKLGDVIRILAEDVFDDPQDSYYLIIDKLDESWVDDKLRYKIIRALIEAVRDFLKVRNVKIVVSLRRDLLDRVFRNTRDAGFQEEKYESLMLTLQWERRELTEVLNKRVNALVKHRYTNKELGHRDLLPAKIRKTDITDFLIDRTLYRPRDVIMFFNSCLDEGTNQSRLNVKRVVAAEATYSRGRLRSLGDEWSAEFPNLLPVALAFLQGQEPAFSLGERPWQKWVDDCLLGLAMEELPAGELWDTARACVSGKMPAEDGVRKVFRVFHKVGLVGLKLAAYEGVTWSFLGHRTSVMAELNAETRVHVCPAFYRALGINCGKERWSSN